MSLWIAGKTKDAIVISADGKVTRPRKKPYLKQRKVFHIANGIHFAVSGNIIGDGEIELFSKLMSAHFRASLPQEYQGLHVLLFFYTAVQEVHRDDIPNFQRNYVIGGFSNEKKPKPFLYSLDSLSNYQPKECNNASAGDYYVDCDKMPKTTKALIAHNERTIRQAEQKISTIGGQIITVIIKGNDVEETIQKTD